MPETGVIALVDVCVGGNGEGMGSGLSFCLRCLASKTRFAQALGIAQAAALGVSGSY